MQKKLQGKIALITGGSRGIGAARISSGLVASYGASRVGLRKSWNQLAVVMVLGLASGFGLQVSNAQYTILHNFGDGTVPNDGAGPATALNQGHDGYFYGTTERQAGSAGLGNGTLFRMAPDGTMQIIHYFSGKKYARASLLDHRGELLGVASSRAGGVIFRAGQFGKTEIWHSFSQNDPGDGFNPLGGLIFGSDGNLYGTTYEGGGTGNGIIYQISLERPHPLTVLYSFGSLGIRPRAALLLGQDGNYYGTTVTSPGTGGGTIFQMTPSEQVTFVYHFPGPNDQCQCPLIQGHSGNFYGSVTYGGKHEEGYVFKMTPAFQVTVLHQFSRKNGDGDLPNAVILGPKHKLYGTTSLGGAGQGVIFELGTDGSFYKILHSFGDGTVPNDGSLPFAGLALGSDSNLYGTTLLGGSANDGTIYRVTP